MNNRVSPVYDSDDGSEMEQGQDNLLNSPLRHFHSTSASRRRSTLLLTSSVVSLKTANAAKEKRDEAVEVINIEATQTDQGSLAKPKELAQPMSVKRRYMKSVRAVETIKTKRISGFKAYRMRVAMSWKTATTAISVWTRDYALWKGHLREVEGRFGSGVSSFFVFLRQLFFLNILTFILEFGLVSLPTIIIDSDTAYQVNTNSCSFDTSQSSSENSTIAQDAADFISGQGWVNTTLMFYAGYPPSKLISAHGVEYDLPLAYLLVGLSYFLVNLILVLRSLSKGLEARFSHNLGTASYTNKLFAGWEYSINEEKAARLKHATFVQSLRARIAEELRLQKVKTRSTRVKCGLYSLRCFTSFLVLALLGGAVYAIYFVVVVSTDHKYQHMAAKEDSRLVQLLGFAPSLTITILNVILPVIFDILSRFEDWSASFEVSITLFRTAVLKMASLIVLIITLYSTVESNCEDQPERCCQQNWENQIASQMYMLIWTDFFAHLFSSLAVNILRKVLHKHTKCFKVLGLPKFDIAKQVLVLVHDECLIWIGTFFSPIMPAMAVVKLFILFYVDKVSVMFSNKPPDKVYQASRSNYLFTVLLLISFFMCVFAVGYGVTRVRPSCQGPFSNIYCSEDARIFDVFTREVSSWPPVAREIMSYVATATFLVPVLTVACLILFYFKNMTNSLLDVIQGLKDQLAVEGREKRILAQKLAKYEFKSPGTPTLYVTSDDENQNALGSPNDAQQPPEFPKTLNF